MKTSKRFILILFLKINLIYSGLILHDASQVNKNVKVIFSFSLRKAYQYELGDFYKIYDNENFDKNRPTAIYIHGFYDDGEKDFSAMAIRSAYRERNDTNFITIDWQHYSKCFLYQNVVIPQLQIICETVALNLKRFLDLGYDAKKIHLVGHSLGGQCIGLVARHLRGNSDYVIRRLYALDPAGPGFEAANMFTMILSWVTFRSANFAMISRMDAEYVQIIHTNAGKYGMKSSRGHADFYPNSGTYQNGCDLELMDDVCSHRRAWVYYQESVFPRKPFFAVRCNSYEDFKQGNCKSNTKTQMGLSDATVEGKFYLLTHSNPQFTSLGEDGIEYSNFHVITDGGVIDKPLLMSNSNATPKWEKSIEFDELLVVTKNGEFKKQFVALSSPQEVMGDDFEYVDDSSCAIFLNAQILLIVSLLCIQFKVLT